jgi:ERO1-like protein alpha
MIMDCVECEKCKLFGKMQTYGLGIVHQNLRLGTALKILFSDNPHEYMGRIKRNELIAFVNTFAKISSSVHSVALMYDRRHRYIINIGFLVFIV